MTKKERVILTIGGKKADAVPSCFSLHFPKDKSFGEAGIKSHLDFFNDSDSDICKIMNENLVPPIGCTESVKDYVTKVKPFNKNTGFIKEQIEFAKRILDNSTPDRFHIGTLHTICASSIHPLEMSGMPYTHVRELLVSMFREDPKGMKGTMQLISDGMCELAQEYIKMGLDGVYIASLGAEKRYYTDEEFAEFVAPYDIQIMKAVKEAGGYNFLHMCKDGLDLSRYLPYMPYTDVVNWGIYEAPLSLKEGIDLFKGKTVLGGLPNRTGVLVDGREEEIRSAVRTVINEAGNTPLILGADCTLATEQDISKLKIAIDEARR